MSTLLTTTSVETDTNAAAELARYRECMRRAVAAARSAAEGDLEGRIAFDDLDGECLELAIAINRMLDVTDAFVRESRASLRHASRKKYWRRVIERGLPGTFRNAAKGINVATAEMEAASKQLADADSHRLQLADDFERQIQGVVATVASSATEMQATATTLATTAEATTQRSTAVAAASEETSANVQTVASATEELTASAGEIGRDARNSAQIAESAVREAAKADESVRGLLDASQKIGRVLKLISQVASQTKLLALNANIEAARAGEAGKGFAVVASEVKSLAQETSKATEDIGEQIASMQEASQNAAKVIQSVSATIGKMNGIATSIAQAVEQQQLATGEISKNVQQAALGTQDVARNITDVTHAALETSTATGQMLEASSALSVQAEHLQRAVKDFLVEVRAKR